MLSTFRSRPLLSAFLIVLLYAIWFVLPVLVHGGIDLERKGIVGIEGALTMWRSEVVTAVVLALLVSLLGWWREIGFRSVKKGGLKFLLPIFFIALIFLNLAWVLNDSPKWFLGFDDPQQLFFLISVVLLLGFVEEGIFRGVLFYGLSTQFTPLFTVILTALVFGLFHIVNLFAGAPLDQTIFQMIHAGAMGFLYAALRLRLGAVWPIMLIHALWDFSLFVLESSHHQQKTPPAELSLTLGIWVALPALFYGIFVYWRWSKTKSSITQQRTLCLY